MLIPILSRRLANISPFNSIHENVDRHSLDYGKQQSFIHKIDFSNQLKFNFLQTAKNLL